MALPELFQRFIVQPSELALETPYLKHSIASTRAAYQLDAIQETAYPALSDLTPEVLSRNQDTVENIRLWDARPLLQTYQQTQAIRLYYQFYNVGVDRYHLPDGYHQVMLATRELSPALPAEAQTWVNQRLEFTHGYGMVMNFVSKTVGGGFPQYRAGERSRRIHQRSGDHSARDLLWPVDARDTGSLPAAPRSSTIPRATTTSTPAMPARAASRSTACCGGCCSPGTRATSTSCSPPI